MLILTRRAGEKVRIGDDVEVTFLGLTSGRVRSGISAPRSVPVHREEVYERIGMERQRPAPGESDAFAHTPV